MRRLRPYLAEFIGTALLLAVIVGSGIMGQQLAAGNLAVALLANSIATGCGLYVLITLLGPISGAHFNPLVTTVFCARGERAWRTLPGYAAAQVSGAVSGVWLTHAMFGLPILQSSTHGRSGGAQWLSEGVATFGLVLTILGGVRQTAAQVPTMVAAYVMAAYWFTASTSFANPAVTLARSQTNSFAGIDPAGLVGFLLSQCAGAAAALVVAKLLGFCGAPSEKT